MKIVAAIGVLALAAAPARAHHSSAAIYDRGSTIEAEGVITEISWTNPHVRFKLRGAEAGGRERIWDIESNSVSIVSRFGLTADLVAVGNRVKVAGAPGRVADNVMWITNMLLPSSEEILFGSGIPSRWSQRTIGTDIRSAVAADSGKRGVFRVWTNTIAPPLFWGNNLPLTPAAVAARSKYDPLKDDPTHNCAPKGMPYVMEQPYPIELVDEGDTILLKMEEYDTVRRISLTAETSAADRGPARLGTSLGHWEGETLVVVTTDIEYAFFNATGIPFHRAAQIEERFTLNADGSRLEYTMTVNDPETFTAPVTLRKAWEWRPGEQVRPYDCRR